MLRRFAAASGIASIAIAFAVLGMFLSSAVTVERVYPLVIVWCFVPLAWGLWALCAPAHWVPRRLPNWGAILGLFAGLLGAFVLDVPSQLLGEAASVRVRVLAVGALVVVYYAFWMVVRVAYGSLATSSRPNFSVKWMDASGLRLWQTRAAAGVLPNRSPIHPEAAQHVADAHRLLQGLRNAPERHPDLDEAVEKLEMALSALAIKTGGLL